MFVPMRLRELHSVGVGMLEWMGRRSGLILWLRIVSYRVLVRFYRVLAIECFQGKIGDFRPFYMLNEVGGTRT